MTDVSPPAGPVDGWSSAATSTPVRAPGASDAAPTPTPTPTPAPAPPPVPVPVPAEGNPEHPAAHGGGLFGLSLGALGIVFGDIGTSPLYAVQTVFSIDHNSVQPTAADVYGVVSLIFWSVTLVVTVKYVTLVLRAETTARAGSWRSPRSCRRCSPGRPGDEQRSRFCWACSARRCSTATR